MKVYTEIYLSTNIIIKSDSADMSMSITEAMDKLESHWGKTPYVEPKDELVIFRGVPTKIITVDGWKVRIESDQIIMKKKGW